MTVFEKGQRVKVNYPPAPSWNGEGVVNFVSEETVSVTLKTGKRAAMSGGFQIAKGYVTPLQDENKVGIGGAPTRATTLPITAKERKQFPIASGFLDYFPDAVVAIAHISYRGNQQHNPDKPLHWDRSKSADEADTMMRHFLQRGTFDNDGVLHSAKMAWRALALLQKELEEAKTTGNTKPTTESVQTPQNCSQTGQV